MDLRLQESLTLFPWTHFVEALGELAATPAQRDRIPSLVSAIRGRAALSPTAETMKELAALAWLTLLEEEISSESFDEMGEAAMP